MRFFSFTRESVAKSYSDTRVVHGYEQLVNCGMGKGEWKVFSSYIPVDNKKLKILEVGCGCGRVAFALAKKGFSVVGMDIAPGMVRCAKKIASQKKSSARFTVGDIVDFSVPDESYNHIVFFYNGINHLSRRDILWALKNIYELLSPGGYFIFTSHISDSYFRHFFTSLKYYVLQLFGFFLRKNSFPCFGSTLIFHGSYDRFSSGVYLYAPHLLWLKKKLSDLGFDVLVSERMYDYTKIQRLQPFERSYVFVCKKNKEE